VISTIETFYEQIKQEKDQESKVWGPVIFHRVIQDEAHSFSMSETPFGKFRQVNGTLVKMDSCD
jgi:type I site-specific restriction endonuclease